MKTDPDRNADSRPGWPIGSFLWACLLVVAAFVASLVLEAGRR